MKRVLAAWMLAARYTVWKLLGLILAMAAFQLILAPVNAGTGYAFFGDWRLWLSFSAAMVLLCLCLCLQGCQFSKGKMVYTLERLPLSELWTTGIWALNGLICIAVLWAAQLALLPVLWTLYSRNQTVWAWLGTLAQGGGIAPPDFELFVEVYSTPFLHGLMPLDDVAVHVRNVVWCAAMAISAASFGFCQRRGKLQVIPAILAAVGLRWLPVDGVGYDNGVVTLEILAYLFLAALAVAAVWRRWYEAD